MEYQDFMQLLSSPDFSINRLNIADSYPKPLEWITEDPLYQSWQGMAQSSILELTGPSGCGKAYVASYILHSLHLRNLGSQALFLSFDFSSCGDQRDSERSLVSSLSRQILILKPDLCRSAKHLVRESPLLCKDLWALFQYLLSASAYPRIFLVLNAVDRCRGDLMKELRRLVTTTSAMPPLKILITSAQSSTIKNETKILSMPLKVAVWDKAIRMIATERISTIIENRLVWKHMNFMKQDIIEKLCYTDSTYISVMMNLDILERNHTVTTLSALKTLLDTPVFSAETAFESMIGNIRSSELAKQALNWLFYAVRPLSVSELAVALALTQNRSPSDNKLAGELTFEVLIDNVSWDIMKELGSILGATIKIVDERIMLIHDEFRDYLEHKSGILMPKFNATITEQCLNYLLIYPKYKAKVSIDIDRLEIPRIGVAAAFIEYASLHWIDHYKREFPSKPVSDEKAQPTSYKKADNASDKKAEPTLDENAENVSDEKAEPTSDEKAKAITDEKVISFLETEEASQAWFKICASALRWKQGFPKHVLLQAIQLQLDQLVQILLAKALSANIQDCIDGGAKISAETGNTTSLESLPDKTGSVDLRQLLEAAARGGHVDTINLIIARMDADTLETCKSDKSSKAPVLLSVMSGNPSAVRTLLDLKFSIQVLDEDHNTPAHIACQSGDVEMLKVMRELHESDFDLFMTRQNNQALCPLQLACQAGSVEAFDFVLEHSPIDKIKQSSEGSTNPIQLAAVSGHYKIVKKLLKAGAERSTGREGHTPLELAVAEGHYDVVHVLLREFNTQDEDLTEEILQTGRKDEKLIPKSILEGCLDKAIIDGHSEIVRLLVKKSQRNSHSDKCRMINAINSGHLDVVRVLAEEGISPIEWPEIHNPLLDIAIGKNFVDIVHYLVEEGLAPQDNGSRTSIHYAAHLGHEYCIREMLRKMIATEVTDAIQRSDCNSMTAFERAAAAGNFHAFKELLMWQNRAAGPDESPPPRILILAIQSPNDKHTKVKFIEFLIDNHWEVNKMGKMRQQIPLHAAINQQHQEVVKLLLKRRASIDAVNYSQETCLHVALKLKNTSAAKDMMEILLENGANPDLSDSEGQTALHCIAARPPVFGSEDDRCIVNSLIDHNADVNALTENRMTPLYTSIKCANKNMASYLLEEGKANPNIYGGTLHSPLQLAVSRGYKDLVIRLLKVKADLNAIGGSFGSGLHAAAWTGATDIVNLLLENHASVDLEALPFGKPLHVLAFTPQASALEFEQIATNLHAYKASINAYDYNQCTPLILAISRGKEFEARTLIALGADTGVLDGSKSTALHHAAQLGLKSCVIALVEAGAEVDIRDGWGRSVLQRAILGFDLESESDASVFELLLEKLPVDKRKVNLEDALSASLKIDSREIFNTIIEEDDINLNIPDKSGWTSLDVAHCYELPDVIHMLENKGAKRGQQKEPTEWCSWDRANLVKLSPDKMEAWIEGINISSKLFFRVKMIELFHLV